MDRKQKSRCPPASRATRADKEKDKKEGFVESKGAVAVKDGGMEGQEGWRDGQKAKEPLPSLS